MSYKNKAAFAMTWFTVGDSRQSSTLRSFDVPAAVAPCNTKRTRREFFVTSLTMVPAELVSWFEYANEW